MCIDLQCQKQEYDFENHWTVPVIFVVVWGGVCTRIGVFVCVVAYLRKFMITSWSWSSPLTFMQFPGTKLMLQCFKSKHFSPLSYSIGPIWCFLLWSVAFLSPQCRTKCCDVSSLARLGFSLVLCPFLSMMIVCIFYSRSCCTNSLICLRWHHTAHGNHISAKIFVNGCSVDPGPSAGKLSLLMFLSVVSYT